METVKDDVHAILVVLVVSVCINKLTCACGYVALAAAIPVNVKLGLTQIALAVSVAVVVSYVSTNVTKTVYTG